MKTIKFAEYAATPTEDNNCVLLLAISGNTGTIRRKLFSIIEEMDEKNYGKPCQGIFSQFNSCAHVITPIWKGQEY